MCYSNCWQTSISHLWTCYSACFVRMGWLLHGPTPIRSCEHSSLITKSALWKSCRHARRLCWGAVQLAMSFGIHVPANLFFLALRPTDGYHCRIFAAWTGWSRKQRMSRCDIFLGRTLSSKVEWSCAMISQSVCPLISYACSAVLSHVVVFVVGFLQLHHL